jgi:5'-3' exoribonuclease 1
LTTEERARNNGNVLSTSFIYDDSITATYPSTLQGFFPDIMNAPCKSGPFTLPSLDGIELVLGLLDGVHLGVSALAGFPSLQTLPHQGALGYHGVNVFQSDSRNQSMVITLTGKHDKPSASEIAKGLLGQRVFHSWPYLHEGIVVGVSDDMFRYELQQMGKAAKPVGSPHNPFQAIAWKKQGDNLEHAQSKRYGVIIGHVDVLLHVRPLKGEREVEKWLMAGLKRLDTGALVKDYEGADKEIMQPYQTAVHQVVFEDERYMVSERVDGADG